jgi:hypothetical protein
VTRVAVSGASGFLGSALLPALAARGADVVCLVRGPARDPGSVTWDPERGRLDPAALEGVEAAIHLSGATVGRRWSPEVKRDILESRARSTGLLAGTLAALRRPPGVLVSASAVGYYGDRGDEELTEDSGPGGGFLPEVAQAWEGAAGPARAAGIRVVHARIGLVLSARGGVLPRIALPFRLGLGGVLGSGRQWMSWIALEDMVDVFLRALDDPRLDGPVNAVAPAPVTQRDFTRSLSRALHRPAWLPVPARALRLALGGFADEGLLASVRAVPARLLAAGHRFRFPALDGTLLAELGPQPPRDARSISGSG